MELADTPATLFRGNTLASKVMAVCFRLFGCQYLTSLLRPVIDLVMSTEVQSYEVEQSRYVISVVFILMSSKIKRW